MDFKERPFGDASLSMASLTLPDKAIQVGNSRNIEMLAGVPTEHNVSIDLREVYFLIMRFLSAGPFNRSYNVLWEELLKHQLLPRRYHAWYSRYGFQSGVEEDDGISVPLSYSELVGRYPHIGDDHLVKLLRQLILSSGQLDGMIGGGPPNAADVPTVLGSGSFSLITSDKCKEGKAPKLPSYLRWPHMHADQVRGLSLREIGGGFTKHHRAPSVRAACYAIAKPSTLVQKMQIIKRLHGHQNAVYCATFDRSGRYVITGSDDRLVKIWSMDTAFCLASCRGHEGDITDLAVSCNNTLVASSSNDFVIRVWRIPDGLPISVLKGHTGVVTAIAFSPRPSAAYQLLSSSDDGTCRIWDARYSQPSLRVYKPKPPEAAPGKNNEPAAASVPPVYQITCCAFNSSGTVFVTGSSDSYARVWNACKSSAEEFDQSLHEMDLLSGHENDVNYVQFSGCAVASRFTSSDNVKEDNVPKFKNSWFTHDCIVTCSRDGSAIIWVPRSRRSHGKVGRWTRAYHLKVPPPPMPPQPTRGGPRQRQQQTPRGVNMIVWSLDNRFVLAAITDCRICVWNASDGSLVHSLTGHKEFTFVLDVHPFNPRIAMSAGYDGKTIIWDIWEGKPVQIYETGQFRLVDGKFSPDGTSIVLSDEVGQIFVISTGQGESQKDAKYDQFFLGDYRPLIQDLNGNVLDQETQLQPHRRNMQDLLCDSSMLPYPEPYQSMFQKRRLGILGIEWRPSSFNLAVGPTYDPNTGEFQTLPIIDPETWLEPLPEIPDFAEFELGNEVQSDDTDSEYNVTDDFASEGEHEILSCSSRFDSECSSPENIAHIDNASSLRRSKRKKLSSDAEIVTSSGRRVKRKIVDENRGSTSCKLHNTKKSSGRNVSKKKKHKCKGLRPQRRAARNALDWFSKIKKGNSSDEEDEFQSESSYSDSEPLLSELNDESSESTMQNGLIKHSWSRGSLQEQPEFVAQSSLLSGAHMNSGTKLVLKIPRSSAKALLPSDNAVVEGSGQKNDTAEAKIHDKLNEETVSQSHHFHSSVAEIENVMLQDENSGKSNQNTIKWGEVKPRTTKRLKIVDSSTIDMWPVSTGLDGPSMAEDANENHGLMNNYELAANFVNHSHLERNGDLKSLSVVSKDIDDTRPDKFFHKYDSDNQQVELIHKIDKTEFAADANKLETSSSKEHLQGHGVNGDDDVAVSESNGDDIYDHLSYDNHVEQDKENGGTKPLYTKLRIKSKGLAMKPGFENSKLGFAIAESMISSQNGLSSIPSEQNILPAHNGSEGGETGHGSKLADCNMSAVSDQLAKISEPMQRAKSDKMYISVYRRSKFNGTRKNVFYSNSEESTSLSNDSEDRQSYLNPRVDNGCVRRSNNTRLSKNGLVMKDSFSKSKQNGGFLEASTSGRKSYAEREDQLRCNNWRSPPRTSVGLRSTRNRREAHWYVESLEKSRYQHIRKISWLMLVEHEESYRYIPQKGDEVYYLRQGHEEYIKDSRSYESLPCKSIKNLKSVELCKVIALDYSTLAGSGESCCKLTLEIIDRDSNGLGRSFQVTLPELVSFPDFLVEKRRYDASMERSWTTRDKCLVWWRSEDGHGGSWWEGRILALKPKSQEFPESPWEKFVIKYKDSSEEHLHSPWELHDADSAWQHPHVDVSTKNKLLSNFAKLERLSERNEDYYGAFKLNQDAQKADFINRYPVQFSIEVIKKRIENNYYRTLDAVKHDASVMLEYARLYFRKKAEMMTKMRRLSDWVDRHIQTL